MDSNIVLSVLSVIGTLSSIVFAYLAFSRNKAKDIKHDATQQTNVAVDIASIKIDTKYTRDSLSRIDRRLDDYERAQTKLGERLAKIEEHQYRIDIRLDKLEKHHEKE